MDDFSDHIAALAQRLPPDLQAALKRKSSRDPNSRFPRKLHLLLTYLSTDPALEEEIGLSWINDTHFKMKKKNVAAVMGIKLNTMNVNLRDLGFEQLQHDKNGWTEWKKDGFTRNSLFNEGSEGIAASDPSQMLNPLGMPQGMLPPTSNIPKRSQTKKYSEYSIPMTIEQVSPIDKTNFEQTVNEIWGMISGGQPELPASVFIEKAAEYFRQPEQPIQNAQEVISAIVDPSHQSTLNRSDLYKFLAMFGPPKTAMLKIASLLLCSNNNGNWLYFDPRQVPQGQMNGSFDPLKPNCLVIRYSNNVVRRVWNHPIIDAFGIYLIDDNENRYTAWDKYFESEQQQQNQQMNQLQYI